MKVRGFILIFMILSLSCDDKRQNFDRAIIPFTPVNFSAVNSWYDDYNSDLSISWNWKFFSLIFSTNRDHGGGNFDFIHYFCEIRGDLITGQFTITPIKDECSLVDSVNSDNNELGPYFTFDYKTNEYLDAGSNTRRFFFTSDATGNNDIYYCYYTNDIDRDIMPVGRPAALASLNSEHDDGYLTLHNNEVPSREVVYFTSNRDGSYDIYHALSEEAKLIDESSVLMVTKVEDLSSSADDKCPYIKGNMMAFASDRPGGFGGFDLWYSLFDGQSWSEPVNFGEKINTEYDEYRPVLVSTYEEGFFNDLMLFSSNRPGGKGRFDLYYVGLKMKIFLD